MIHVSCDNTLSSGAPNINCVGFKYRLGLQQAPYDIPHMTNAAPIVRVASASAEDKARPWSVVEGAGDERAQIFQLCGTPAGLGVCLEARRYICLYLGCDLGYVRAQAAPVAEKGGVEKVLEGHGARRIVRAQAAQ
eukprot:1777704-Pleurochrysis_carterae.AAC.8